MRKIEAFVGYPLAFGFGAFSVRMIMTIFAPWREAALSNALIEGAVATFAALVLLLVFTLTPGRKVRKS